MSVYARGLMLIGFGVAIVATVLGAASRRYDDTDDVANGIRSNMELRTDYGTGCQYLVTGYGMTPRLNGDGKPMCGK